MIEAGLLPLAAMLPAVAMSLGFAGGARLAERLALLMPPLGFVVALAVAAALLGGGEPLVYHLGAWVPPLGLALRADGLSTALLLTTTLILGITAVFARAEFGTSAGEAETRRKLMFWCLLLALWTAMACVLLSNDLFNLFVGLELLTFAAVPLAALDGKAETLAAALRYLVFALLGSVLYLLGVALLYGSYGTLDIGLLRGVVRVETPTILAAALMTAGLIAKSALFPLHLWLPPAHAGAPAAASAMLSALVVKGSVYLLIRLWFFVMPPDAAGTAMQILAGLGAAAILLGSLVALRQARLKLLIAYSTIAQIGYLFFMFPLVLAGGSAAWLGGVLQAVSHAFAKASMFLAAGVVSKALGHDCIAGLGGVARAMPVPVIAFGLAGLSLMGIPPSGGFTAKWLLLQSALQTGQWWWAVVMLGGGLLTGGYVFRVLVASMGSTNAPVAASGIGLPEKMVLLLALISVVLGMLPLYSFGLVEIGRP
ncbi:NADH-quinone oxidoreductase subunit J [Roseococcus sp. SYP-B2431]|uniref:complex I subunit 5 family protein n=1 Tax=Roseococcus sp. SYP-B2431 TaxID=2496640 RepID=UPI00103DB651|nr:proton-conducting transporter membrane subunit [Roseococcus sp. SYP-B2431]TCI00233.1 NADH-quinone oxidoreductase subunit J [Roseococcus sp. SYP-B2431]